MRPLTEDDLPACSRLMAEGFATYAAFAPPGWTSPEQATPANVARLRATLRMPGAFGRIADDDTGFVLGHPRPGDDARTFHLRNLFVTRAAWGTGLADQLMEAALQHAAAHGLARAFLQTPAASARARAFYARHGFAPEGEPQHVEPLGLDVLDLARRL